MTPSQRLEELFEQALALPAEEREPWLGRACADDESLRKKVLALLQSHEAAQSFMESSPTDLTHDSKPGFEIPTEEKPGDRIGRYKILQKIGEGGCGVVFMAEQEESVRRRVALKVIKLGMDTKAVIARFEAERQALARMEHPNIARVLDAGATSSGRPYFVMELVRGMRITDYCDQNNLSTEQRLDLFIKVCQAIQHAHQKGVIHRDIKPSNILVTLHDGAPVPKVIDFGIAKATQGRLTEQTLFTAFEQFIGTPAYVSPEQAEMSGLDIDTRSDIYSLGVLLYELLAGRTPFDMQQLVASGIDEMRRQIREQEPPRPSLRLRTLNDEDRTTVARRRGTDAPRLSLRLRGDLDWIVMRCLEKDRSRRYETANGLAQDIQRHLDNEPVTARPPSTAYLLQKLIRRHRLAFGAGAAIALAVVGGSGMSLHLLFRARTAERFWEDKTKEAEKENVRRSELANKLTKELKDIGLAFARGGDQRELRERLDQATKRKKELADQSEVEAGVDETLGTYYYKLGEYKRAEELLIESIEMRSKRDDKPEEVAKALNFLGLVYSLQSKWDKAEVKVKEALELLQHRLTKQYPEDPEIARTQFNLGWMLQQQAKLSEAENFLKLALEQQRKLKGCTPDDVVASLSRLGSVQMQDGRMHDAEANLREALDITVRDHGHDSLATASVLTNLAVAIAANQARIPDGIALFREAVEIRQRINNPEAASVPPTSRPSAAALTSDGKPTASVAAMLAKPGALAELEAGLRDQQLLVVTTYGKGSWEEAFYLALTAWVLLGEKKYAEAEAATYKSLQIRLNLRPDDWSVYHARHMLGAAKAGQLRFDEAESLLIDGYRGMKERLADIPTFHKARLGEAANRIEDFFKLRKRADAAAEWRAEFKSLPPEAQEVLVLPILTK